MMSNIFRGIAAFCVATVLTQVILLSYFLIQGTMNRKTAVQLIALVNGIDVTGNRLQEFLRRSEEYENQVLRKSSTSENEKLDMDVRLRSQQEFRDELSIMLADFALTRIDSQSLAFRTELKELKQEAEESGIQEVQRTI